MTDADTPNTPEGEEAQPPMIGTIVEQQIDTAEGSQLVLHQDRGIVKPHSLRFLTHSMIVLGDGCSHNLFLVW